MIPLTVSTFNPADVSEHDENAIPNDELASSTSASVKESNIQVSFAEQTVSEMRQILSDWKNSATTPEKRQPQPMRQKSLTLMDIAQERPKGRSLSVSSPMKGKRGIPSPTNTLQTEMMDSESVLGEGSYLNDSLRFNDDSFVSDEDDWPYVSFLPSSDVLQQSTAVLSIIQNTARQISEVGRTIHATKYDAVIVELQQRHELLKINDEMSNDQVSQHVHIQETFLPPTKQTGIDNRSLQRAGTKEQKSRSRQQLFTYLVIPIALSILATKVWVAYSEVQEEDQ